MNNEWIRFEAVEKSFPHGFWGRPMSVINQISFGVRSKRVTGFVGANGSGKTTLLKLALGFIQPTQGKINYPLSANNFLNFRSQLGYLPERPYYYDFLTATEFLKLHWQLGGGRPTQFVDRCEQVLERVKLLQEKNQLLRTFSKGMLQRIGIAQALIHNPDFLVLDEPMSGLDPDGRYQIRELLAEEKAKGRALFFSSHLLEDVEALCDDIILIAKGRLSFAGSLEDLKQQTNSKNLSDIIAQLQVGGRR